MRKLVALLAAMFFSVPALAAQWHVDPVTSRLTFAGEQGGEKFEGSFPKFSSNIDFDEATPEKGSIKVTIDMSRIQIEGKDRMDALPTDDWFSVTKFPQAEFASSSIKKTGEHQFAATGKLTIKGVSRDVTLPFTLKTNGKSTVATGALTLSRKDFAVGTGRWETEEWVKYPVTVSYEIHASAQ